MKKKWEKIGHSSSYWLSVNSKIDCFSFEVFHKNYTIWGNSSAKKYSIFGGLATRKIYSQISKPIVIWSVANRVKKQPFEFFALLLHWPIVKCAYFKSVVRFQYIPMIAQMNVRLRGTSVDLYKMCYDCVH